MAKICHSGRITLKIPASSFLRTGWSGFCRCLNSICLMTAPMSCSFSCQSHTMSPHACCTPRGSAWRMPKLHPQHSHLHCFVHAWPQCRTQTLVTLGKAGKSTQDKEDARGTRTCGTKAYSVRKPRVGNAFSLCLIEVALQCIMMESITDCPRDKLDA